MDIAAKQQICQARKRAGREIGKKEYMNASASDDARRIENKSSRWWV